MNIYHNINEKNWKQVKDNLVLQLKKSEIQNNILLDRKSNYVLENSGKTFKDFFKFILKENVRELCSNYEVSGLYITLETYSKFIIYLLDTYKISMKEYGHMIVMYSEITSYYSDILSKLEKNPNHLFEPNTHINFKNSLKTLYDGILVPLDEADYYFDNMYICSLMIVDLCGGVDLHKHLSILLFNMIKINKLDINDEEYQDVLFDLMFNK